MSGPGMPSCARVPRSHGLSSRSAKMLRLGALAGWLLLTGFALGVPSAGATPTTMVDLGAASTYAVLSGASVGNTVSADGAPHTTLRGNLGVKANAQPTGFPPGIVTGTVNYGNPAATQAHDDLVAAYNDVAGRTGGATLAGALVGRTIQPGLYTIPGAVSNTGTVTLDGGGNPNAVFVFQVNGALAMAAGSHVVLTNGAQASRVFWQVNGAGAIGASADFAGTLMALDAVAVGNGTMVNGRAFARNGALTLDDNEFYSAPPVVTIAGGAGGDHDRHDADDQRHDRCRGAGSRDRDDQRADPHRDPVRRRMVGDLGDPGERHLPGRRLGHRRGGEPGGSATQQLTVDTVLPVVTLDGGASVTTNDPTPTIAGTSDVAPGTIVHVTVGSQTLTALVQSTGIWNIAPHALSDGAHTVTASVADPAGNLGTDSQALTIDTTAPAVSITGGATALTNDATPDISGTADVAAGTTVTVTLADETLSGAVQGDGTWSVTAAALSDGPHRVVMSVSDAAGNPASFTQTLTVDTVSPFVAITGGATATTNDVDPTITGTSDAAPGTTVTVSIAGQTMTTLLQANGTWNATPTAVAAGAWAVVAAVPDPAGNVGSAGQMLSIAANARSGPGGTGSTGITGSTGTAPTLTPIPTLSPAVTPADPISAVAGTAVAGGGSQKVTGSSLSIGLKVTASARGRVVAVVNGTVRITGLAKAIKLTTTTVAVAAGQSATLRVQPAGTTRAVKAALAAIKTAVRARKHVTATITVKIVDAAGNTRELKRTVRLV